MENKLTLRKFDFRSDLEDLFYIMMDSQDQMLFHGRFQVNSLPDFEKWMINNTAHIYHDFYVIFDESDYNIVGYIYSYDYRAYDGHCKVCTFIKQKYRDIGVGAICGINFLNELFVNYPIRKIYIDVFDYNRQSLKSNLDAGFVEEGLLKEFRYYDGKYHDMHLLAITRERFYEKFNGVIGK